MSSENWVTDVVDMDVDMEPVIAPTPEPVEVSLMHAIQSNDSSTVALILSINNINLDEITDENGNTALHYGVLANNLELVTLLLENRASANAMNDEQHTPMYFAIHAEQVTNRVSIVEVLEKFGGVYDLYQYASLTESESPPPAPTEPHPAFEWPGPPYSGQDGQPSTPVLE